MARRLRGERVSDRKNQPVVGGLYEIGLDQPRHFLAGWGIER